MKKFSFFFFIIFILASCTRSNYNLGFKLGSSEEDIVNYIQENNLECRYENKLTDNKVVLRIYNFKYKDIDFSTIRLGFSNDKLCYIQYRVHNYTGLSHTDNIEDCKKDNISLAMTYLKKKYGEPKENTNYKDHKGKYYWGEMKSKFMIIEPCSETYTKIHIGDSSLDSSVTDIYRELLLDR